MDTLDKFFAAPSDQVLDTLTKEQLCDVSDHYNFELGLRKNAKLSQIRQVVRTKLAERKVLPSIASMDELEPEGASTPRASLGESRSNFGLTFEQQKELLEMQQREREAERREREAERQLEYNKIKSDREIALERFRLIAEGKIISDTGGDVPIGPARALDISNMARLLPRFN